MRLLLSFVIATAVAFSLTATQWVKARRLRQSTPSSRSAALPRY